MNTWLVLFIFIISILGIFAIYKISQGSIICAKIGQSCTGEIACCKGYTCDSTNGVCTGCTKQSDCAKGYKCNVDKCVPIPDSSACKTDLDCPVDSYCPNVPNATCVIKTPGFCEVDGDCLDHYWCRNYTCEKVPSGKCRADDDCGSNQYCSLDNECYAVSTGRK
jgi:hypothetical protein